MMQKENPYLIFAILSISLLTILAGAAVSPALGRIQQAFPETNQLSLKLILTLPPLMIIPFSLLSGKLTRIFKKRQILLTGLFLYLIGGTSGGLANSITMLLITRAILGMGTGLIAPLAQSLIADFFTGEKRADLMGKSSAVSNLGGIVMPLLAGWLAAINWRYAFFAYLLVLVVIYLTARYLPEPNSPIIKLNQKARLPLAVYRYAIFSFLTMLMFYLIPTNIAIFLETEHIGSAGQAGLTISFLTFASFIIGLKFSPIKNFLGKYLLPTGILFISLGFMVLRSANSITFVLISMFSIGIGIGLLMPYFMFKTSQAVPQEANAPALALVSSSLFLGQFVSPILFSVISNLTQINRIRFDFTIAAFTTLVLAFISFAAVLKGKS
jgi:MFS family permease